MPPSPESPENLAELIIRPQIPVLHRGGYYTDIERKLLAMGVHVVPISVKSDGAGGAPCDLKGWYLQTNPGNPVVIYSHGIHASRGDLVPLAMELYRRGINGVLYDSRAHGMSAAKAITLGYHERHDLRAIVEAIHRAFSFRCVVLFGLSLGGAISLQAADVHDSIRGVVTASAYYDQAACFERYFAMMAPGGSIPPIEAVLAAAARRGGFDLAATGPRAVVPKLARYPRLLVIQGGADELIEVEQARLIEENWQGPCELMIVEEGGHADVLAYREPLDRFIQFVQACK